MDGLYAILSIAMDKSEFGEWIMIKMEEKRFSMTELAARAGVSKQVISKYVNQPPDKYDMDVLAGLARAFDISTEDILRIVEILPSNKTSVRAERLAYQIDQLGDKDQETIETIVGALLEKSRKKNTVTKSSTT